jgi:hypothetical protein
MLRRKRVSAYVEGDEKVSGRWWKKNESLVAVEQSCLIMDVSSVG